MYLFLNTHPYHPIRVIWVCFFLLLSFFPNILLLFYFYYNGQTYTKSHSKTRALTGFQTELKTKKILMGCRQAVRHRTLTPAFVGSNPTISAQTLSFVNHLLRTSDKTSEVLFSTLFLTMLSMFSFTPTKNANHERLCDYKKHTTRRKNHL